MAKSPKELCSTPAHRVLWTVIATLALGVIIALGSRIRSSEIMIIVGLCILMIVVIFICLLDLRLEFAHPKDAGWNNVGFRKCKFMCWEQFSWAVFVSWLIILMLTGFLCVSGGFAMYVRYGTYIRRDFWAFLVEVTLMSVMTAVPIVLVSWNRGGHSLELMMEVGVISGKFGGLHILLELCGFYANVFSDDGEPLERFTIAGAGLSDKNETQLLELLKEQVDIHNLDGPGHETTFLKMLVGVFVITFFLIALVLVKGCFKTAHVVEAVKAHTDLEGHHLNEKQEKKLLQKAQLGARMKAMLALSVILGALMMIVLLLGLRSDAETNANSTVQKVAHYWSLVGSAGIAAALVCSVVAISGIAVFTRFAGFINKCPWVFLAELCLVVLLSVTPLGYVSYDRGHEHEDVAVELGILTLKFGGLHLLLELSGFYATAFGGMYREDSIRKLPRFGDPKRGSLEMKSTEPAATSTETAEKSAAANASVKT